LLAHPAHKINQTFKLWAVLGGRAQLRITQTALFVTPAALEEEVSPVAIRYRMATGLRDAKHGVARIG
jgi:hypothetical protein